MVVVVVFVPPEGVSVVSEPHPTTPATASAPAITNEELFISNLPFPRPNEPVFI
jgi:hypothetical protein